MPDTLTPPFDGDIPALLLVEDSLSIRDLLGSYLRHTGHQVISCSSAENALSCVSSYQGTLQLLITDVVLDGLSGFELVTDGAAIENSIYLEKPFSLQALRNAVQTLLPATAWQVG